MQPILPSITSPKNKQLTIKSDLGYIISRNHASDLITLFFLSLFCSIALIFIIFIYKAQGTDVPLVLILVAALATVSWLLYWPVTLISTKYRSLSITSEGVIVTSFRKKRTYPYSEIHKIVFAKNIEYFTGRPSKTNRGSSLLLLTTDGKIPGFPTLRLAHTTQYRIEDIQLFFDAFEEKDKVTFEEKLTPTDILAWTTGVINAAEAEKSI